MGVREKLIELIAKAKYIYANDYSDHTEDEYIADTLLDNGVTAQEWIAVEDRLPEPFTPVLVYRKSFGTLPSYISIDKMVLWNDDTQVWTDEIKTWKAITTHWMPLPEPPKGE